MDQSDCPSRGTQLEEQAAVLVCMNVDPNMFVSSKVRMQRLCVQPCEVHHPGARCQRSLV